MAKRAITDDSIKALQLPESGNRIDYDVPKGPRDTTFVRGFAVRTTAAGLRSFMLVYVTHSGTERRHKIGDYPAHTVTTARDEARKLRHLVDAGRDPFAEKQTQRIEGDRKKELERATLGGLLSAYADSLDRALKPSAAKVRAELTRTVKVAHPKLWSMPATNVTLDDLVRITNTLVRDGKWRQAEKTRSYIRSAYTAAHGSRGQSANADLFEAFVHVPNVARDLAAIARPRSSGNDQSDSDEARALSAAELTCYWKRINAKDGRHGALLRFHLLTGAQRCEQLSALTAIRHDADAHTITILDGKGRRKKERRHVVPLLPEADAALKLLRSSEGEFLFSVDGGKHGASYHTVRALVLEVAQEMVDADEIGETFTPGTLRRTVETRLAAAGLSKEVRAQLQSHGLGGVQATHYDKHGYLDEKRAALQTLYRLMNPVQKAVVLETKRRKKGAAT